MMHFKRGGIVGLLLMWGCSVPPPVVGGSFSSGTTTSGSESGVSPSTTTGMTSGPVDGSGGEVSGDTTTGTDGGTTGSGSSESSESSGGQPVCHPMLVEVYYDTQSDENEEQWIKLFNPCPEPIELEQYSLGWSGNDGTDYTFGRLDLETGMLPNTCFIVGGPTENGENANPDIDLGIDLDPNLDKDGNPGNGVGLFFGSSRDIVAASMPVDAVIYGDNNDANLMDANGDMPMEPHVDDAGDRDSIRRTELDRWQIESNPMPGLCPPFD